MALRDVDSRPPLGSGRKEPEPLSQSVTHLVEEARMLIPGVTAFLGFQLIAVFNQGSRSWTRASRRRISLPHS